MPNDGYSLYPASPDDGSRRVEQPLEARGAMLPGSSAVSYRLSMDGMELEVTDLEEGWLVRLGSESVEHRYLDHALAILLGVAPADVLPLLRSIVDTPPDFDLAD